jgi:hypothetical protein
MRLALTNQQQLAQLRSTTADLPLVQRHDLWRLVWAHMELEGESTDAAFQRAVKFAFSTLPRHDALPR